ncbi:hypothetical protein SAMN05443428_12030 [Caloramator quimbayensis]|uniref:TusA-related sulfurtransferase n=1 Tax=Caloramator quimbayensis TaxID=1147123 RepID=A0A1T4Y3T8_9CLOT|nr:hypothetical protein [Caloramator quimbayensis]SKA96158.1 hypothetical protein SAMN05443428_12030 [Caloramator quimbayensis]
MSDYRINFGSAIGPADMNKLYGMLSILGGNDELNIILESADAHQTESILKMLDEHDFDAATKGSSDGLHYNIIARRKM